MLLPVLQKVLSPCHDLYDSLTLVRAENHEELLCFGGFLNAALESSADCTAQGLNVLEQYPKVMPIIAHDANYERGQWKRLNEVCIKRALGKAL